VSFFFRKRKASKQAADKRSPMAPRSARQNAPALHRLGCAACPLNDTPCQTPKMKPTLDGSDIYFLAEAPGRDEDENTGKPLTGPSGNLLRQCIVRGTAVTSSFDNVVNCRPPNNRTPVWQEMECCRPRRIKWIEQTKPKLIVGLGAVPLQFMLNSTDLGGMRGRIFAVKVGTHNCHFMPTYHPSFILRVAYDKRKPLNSKFGHCFRMDINRAFTLVQALKPVHIETEAEIKSGILTFNGKGFDKLHQLMKDAAAAPVKAIDLETKGLRPYSEGGAIMSAAISYDDINFSFAIDHPQTLWNAKEHAALLKLFRNIIEDDSIKVAHNAPFELEWLISIYGKKVVNHAAWEDTQVQAHFLDERRGKRGGGDDDHRAPYQNLNFLYRQHFCVSFKPMFKLNKKDMSKSPIEEILPYNAVDTKSTLRLWHKQTQLLKEQGIHDAYMEALPRQPTVALMQTIGIDVDQAEVKRLQAKLDGEIQPIMVQIGKLDVVKQFAKDHKAFRPSSNDDVLTIFRDYMGHKKLEAVAKGDLGGIDHPLAKLIVSLRNLNKLRSTYVDPFSLGKGDFVYPDGKIHTNFNTTFAETGRTSSDAPNMQNFPQRNDAWVRSQIIAPRGHLLVAFDYGQLEGCTAAICSKDKVLVKALWDDYDIHMEWAQKYAKVYPKAGVADKKLRSIIKNKLVFPAMFGAANESIAGYLNAPVDKIDNLMDEFWATFGGLKKWQDKLMKDYYETGWVESPTGRRHRYPLTRNQAINFPVQSVACDVVCDAMNRLSFLAVETGKWHLHPVLNIHDDLTFVIPDNDTILEESIQTICRTMLTPPYRCVNVPLSVSCSMGPTWYGMAEIGKFWSHKDL
jgi:uracil-DNA glycosylase family 4